MLQSMETAAALIYRKPIEIVEALIYREAIEIVETDTAL